MITGWLSRLSMALSHNLRWLSHLLFEEPASGYQIFKYDYYTVIRLNPECNGLSL